MINPTQNLKIHLFPYQEGMAKHYIAGMILGSTSFISRRQLVAVPNNEDAEKLAKYISSLLDVKIAPLAVFDSRLHHDHIVFTQSYDKLCNADIETKMKIEKDVNKNGEKTRGKAHDKYHKDVNCPYHQQKLKMNELYRTDFYALITTIERLAHINFGKSPLSKNITIWLKDGYRDDFNIRPSKTRGKTQDYETGYEEYESEDQWGHTGKWRLPKYKSKPIQIEYTGEEISGYKKVKDASYPRLKDIGWVKEEEENFILPSNLSLVFLNAISQGYKDEINLFSVHYGIFKEELEVIDGCEVEEVVAPSSNERNPKIKLVKTERPINLNATRVRTLKESLPTLKLFLTLLRNWKADPIDVAFIHYNLKELGETIKSTSNKANTRLEEYLDFEENSREIKNLRYNYLNGLKSDWNKIPMEDPQIALYDEYVSFKNNPKTALIYGTPRFINKGYPKQELEYFHPLKSGIVLPSKEKQKEFFEKFCKRLAYLLNLYRLEKTYLIDPYFQYGVEKYPELFGQHFDIEMI